MLAVSRDVSEITFYTERVTAMVVGKLQTWRWAAPETFDVQSHNYNETADNYSYGIVVWEIATSKRRT